MRKIIESLIVGFNGTSFAEIANYLLRGTPVADPYMCLADYESYRKTQEKVTALYRSDKLSWNRKSLMPLPDISPPTEASGTTQKISGISNSSISKTHSMRWEPLCNCISTHWIKPAKAARELSRAAVW